MASSPGSRRLIVNADDFGRSRSINEAVIRARKEGILTSASLMVNEAAFSEAVELAKANPTLGVGLHLTLLCGHSALPPQQIPGLVNGNSEFTDSPARAGFRYFFNSGLREQLRQEIHAQFKKFHETGLPLDHVNGHLHLHLHPTVFRILMEDAAQLHIERLRLTFDPFRLNLNLASGHFFYRALHARARFFSNTISVILPTCSDFYRTHEWMNPILLDCCPRFRRAIPSFTRIRHWMSLSTNFRRSSVPVCASRLRNSV
jgi:hopanoid biosynthesis associated protein HpnK